MEKRSREIKFRAWCYNQYYYNVLVGNFNNAYNMDGDYYELFEDSILEDAIIEQYTGLKDKNGKEIYEGDIIKQYNNIYEVNFDEGGFFPFADSDDGMPYPRPEQCEIIGNKYENPEI